MSDNQAKSDAVHLRREVGRSLRALGTELDRLDDAVARRFALHRTDLRCLEILARCGPMTAGRLAARAGLGTSAMTSLIDRLQRVGYAERVADPADRRRVLVAVTEQGRRDGRAAFAGLMGGTDRLLADYSPSELQLLEQFLRKVRALITEQADAAGQAASKFPATLRTDGKQ